MTLPAPYPPLVSGGEGLDRYPSDAPALASRMAAIYGVPAEQVLPVRGLTHGLELAYRLAARDGGSVEAPKAEMKAETKAPEAKAPVAPAPAAKPAEAPKAPVAPAPAK